MLICPLFHRVTIDKPKDSFTNPLKDLQNLLLDIKSKYPIVLPGQKIPIKKTFFCITFDDAFCDFYHLLFPFLQENQIPVVLGIIPGLTEEKSVLFPEQRMSVSSLEAFQKGVKSAFCSWEELQEMTDTPWVYPACHSFSHPIVTKLKNLEKELVVSKEILQKKLQKTIDTFIYPYGKFDRVTQKKVQMHYTYSFRIGSSVNFSWNNISGLTYRIPFDQKKNKRPSWGAYLAWFKNTLRNR